MNRPAKVMQPHFPLSYVISSEVTAAWVEAYLKNGPDMDVDSHDMFASILDIPRDTAKMLCYQYVHTQPFLKYIHFSAKESAYRHTLKTLKSKVQVDAIGIFSSVRTHMEKKYQDCTAVLFAKKDTSKL